MPRIINNKNIREGVRSIVLTAIRKTMKPYWFVTFHYREGNCSEDKILKNVNHIKNKLKRISYKSRDKSKNNNGFKYPRMIFFNEVSRCGISELHTHMIMEAMPRSVNSHERMKNLFTHVLPVQIRSLSTWKRNDIQLINNSNNDILRLVNYLTKESDQDRISLDIFNSDLN